MMVISMGAFSSGPFSKRLQIIELCRTDLIGCRDRPPRIAVVQQFLQFQALHPLGRRGKLRQGLQPALAQSLERRRPEAGMGDIGGEHLHLGRQILGPGDAAQQEGVVGDGELGVIDLARQRPLAVLLADRLEAALDQDARSPTATSGRSRGRSLRP